jgi:hypothetical protein
MASVGRAVEPITTLKMMSRDDLLDNLASTYGSGLIELLRRESFELAVVVTVRDEFGRELIFREEKP